MSNDQRKDSPDQRFFKKHPWLTVWIVFLVLVAVIAFLAAIGQYHDQFGGPPSDNPAVWGQFGDYLGGVLNPVMALAALGAVLITLTYQAAELKASIEELKKTSDAAGKQAEAAGKQAEAAGKLAEAAACQTEALARSALVQGLSGLLHYEHPDQHIRANREKQLEAETDKLRDLLNEPRNEHKGRKGVYW